MCLLSTFTAQSPLGGRMSRRIRQQTPPDVRTLSWPVAWKSRPFIFPTAEQIFQEGVDRRVILPTVPVGRGDLPDLGKSRAYRHGKLHLSGRLERDLQVFAHQAEGEPIVESAGEYVAGKLDHCGVAPPIARVDDLQELVRRNPAFLCHERSLRGAGECRGREQVIQSLHEVSSAVVAHVEDRFSERLEYLA